MMTLQFHQDAATNFDRRAKELAFSIEQLAPLKQNAQEFASQRVIKEFKSARPGPEVVKYNHRGELIGWSFTHEGKEYSLPNSIFSRFTSLVDSIYKKRTVKPLLSAHYIQRTLIGWLTKMHLDLPVDESFVSHLEKNAAKDIIESSIWLPFAFLEIEHSFPISNSQMQPLTKDLLDDWEERFYTHKADEPDAMQSDSGLSNFRQKYQGLASVVMRMRAEPMRANELALDEAENVTMLLGLVSKGVFIPNKKSHSRPTGSENHTTFTSIHFYDATPGSFYMEHRVLDMTSFPDWRMNAEQIEAYRRDFFDPVSTLLKKDNLSDFEEKLLASLFIYSKAAYTENPVEKLVYMLSALESIFLRNQTESIQQNLAEKMAFFIGEDVETRKVIIKSVKTIYGIRSRYLHHGRTKSELDEIEKFMSHVWLCFASLIRNTKKFSSRNDFLDAIDERKLR